ncbi:hairy/enhancer-of-split related with YRPW motif protein [Battus philenor]|uniref:hairy/enhancer-of-split related with YRPW motif protein n=1 Tax=Battus philenor TaxID=42288 RepID=UPI0035D0BD66
METRHYWEENGHAVKYDNYNSNDGFGRGANDQLNFAAPSEDEAEFPPGAYLKKGKQDPMSHRIIEKRRRDRMNNCLADLSRLIPPEYLKKGRGRVEKTEIIEMAIRHLKFLQDRVNAGERQGGEELFRAGYQEAVGEALRYLAEAHGYPPTADGLCSQLATHLQRHCEHVTKGEVTRDKNRSLGSSSETASSSSSSLGYAGKTAVIQPPPGPPPYAPDHYEPPSDAPYTMDCDRVAVPTENGNVPEALCAELRTNGAAAGTPVGGGKPALRKLRKPDHDDSLHSYKFKNSIQRRFSRSQDSEAAESQARTAHGKLYSHKRRRAARPAPAASTSASASTEDARDTSPQDTSSESTHHHAYETYEKPQPTQYVPVFALNSLGKYYVPLSVEYACVSRQLRACDVLDARAPLAALHPVTIHVNFTPCLNYHVKRDPDPDWRPV